MTLNVNEFAGRFLLHVLPLRFVRIRYFGFFAHRRRKESLPVCRALIAQAAPQLSGPVPPLGCEVSASPNPKGHAGRHIETWHTDFLWPNGQCNHQTS